MTASARLLETARRILEEAGRPLSVRRILRTAESDERFAGDTPTLDALGEALSAGAADGVLVEQRRGIFTLADDASAATGAPAGGEIAPPETREIAQAPRRDADDADEADDADDKPRRRRRRRGAPPVDAGAIAPASLDGTAELSAEAEDRDALKGKLWSRLRERAAQITEQPLAAEPEPPRRRRRRAESDDDAPRAEAVETPAEPAAAASSDEPTDEAPRRRRRRRDPGEADKAPTPQAAEAARTEPKDLARAGRDDRDRRGTDPRADLKARLARRGGGDDAPAREAPPAPEAAIEAAPRTETVEADDGADVRDAVKSKLASRLRGRGAPRREEAPAAPGAQPRRQAPAAAPAETGGGDLKARMRARLSARAGDAPAENSTPSAPSAATPSASDAGDPRSVLRSRLAARLGVELDEPATTEAAPVAETVEADIGGLLGAAPDATPRKAEAAAGDAAGLKARLKARLGGRSDAPAGVEAVEANIGGLLGAATDAPSPAAEPAPPADPSDLKARLRARLAGKGDAPAAPAKRAEVVTPEVAAPAPSAPSADPRAALKARLRGRQDAAPASTPSAPQQAVPTQAAPQQTTPQQAAPQQAAPQQTAADPRAALKARLAQRAGDAADPLEVPLSESRRPYRETRQTPEPAAESERRAPVLTEVSRTSTLVSAALAALREAGAGLSLDALAARVDATAEGGAGGLRAALIAENARRDQAGLRAPFVIHYGGEIGLTEWGLSARYRALEAQMQSALAEQRELVRRDLLARVGDLSDAGFEQVVVLLLERLGHHAVEVVGRRAGTVALVVSRPEEAGAEKIAVVARRSWSAIHDDTVRRLRDTLSHFEAESGLVLTVGTFSPTARREAKLDGQVHVRLIDGAGFARLLHEHSIGLASHQPVLHYVDVGFFESLER